VLAAVDARPHLQEAAPLFRARLCHICKALSRRAATGKPNYRPKPLSQASAFMPHRS
jgi:hypothetical protein